MYHSWITACITVPPEVSVSATKTRIAVGQSTTLTCSVIRNNPSGIITTWSFTDIHNTTLPLPGETEFTLQLLEIMEDEFGTYKCNVTNAADLSGTADIAIEQGCKALTDNLYSLHVITHSICSHT